MVYPSRYNKKELYRAIRNPQKFFTEFRYIYNKFKFNLKYRKEHTKNPLTEDWDNLIILDACRYDILKQLDVFDNKVEYKILNSSTSPEYCNEYMVGNKFYDTIYVTANPFGAEVSNDVFIISI